MMLKATAFLFLLFSCPGFGQLTGQNPAGAWKADQIRLVWQDAGDLMTYEGTLELKGRSFPVYATRRLFGSNFTGSVASRVALKAKIENGQLRLMLNDIEFVLERDYDYRPPREAPAPSASNSPWVSRLSGMKLQQISTGNYDRSHKIWILYPNGTFSFSGESGAAVYSGGSSASYGSNSGGAGTWRVMDQGGQPVLILNYRGSGERTYRLSTDREDKTYLNGVRTFVTPPNEG